VIQLSHLEPFAVGGRRECYVHPDDPQRCIKTLRTDDRKTVRITKHPLIPARWRRIYDNNADEQRQLEKLQRSLGSSITSAHLPVCHGVEPTDLGPGLVLDLVRDQPVPGTAGPGPISRTLRDYLTAGEPLDIFRAAYDTFAAFLLKHRVLTRGLHDHNLVAQHRADGTWRLVLIDGIGDPAWLPFASLIPALGRKKVRKRTDAAWPRMAAFASAGGVSDELIKTSSWDQGMLRHRGDSAPPEPNAH